MAGLKLKKAGAPPAQQPAVPPMDVTRMDVPGMLAKQLNLPMPQVLQLLQQLTTVKSPQEAVELLRNANRNPDTMQQPGAAQPQGLRLPAPQQGA